jgi:hypothetical protein
MAHGDLPTACARLDESLKLDPAVGTLLNLATCEERSGKLVAALEHFKLALSRLGTGDFRVGFTNEQITLLARRVPRLTLHFATPPPRRTRVTCDGIEVTSFDAPIVVDPGTHRIVVEHPGRPSRRLETSVHEGEEKRIEVEVASAAPVFAVAPTPPAREPSDRWRALTFGALGIGGIGIATGTITGIMAINAADTYKEHCVNGACDPEGLSAAETGRTVSVVSPIAFAVGAAFAALGAALFFTRPSAEDRSSK